MGYENYIFSRVDWRERKTRSKNKNLEFYWRPNYSYDKGKTMIFTHIFVEHYDPPIKSGLYDLVYHPFSGSSQERANKLLEWALLTKDNFLTNQRIIYYGDDFTFRDAELMYNNVEIIMNQVKSNDTLNSKIKLFYSTTDNYFNSLRQSNTTFPYNNDNDFFPFVDPKNLVWSGCFTSRPFLKGLVVNSEKYLSTFNRLYFEDLLDRRINNRMNNKYYFNL
jgi:hypothetical protein